MKPHSNVVGAAIVKDGKVLALRRSDGIEQVIHKFEFAGGKVKEGETNEQALIRECREELSLEIEVGDLLNTVEYEYPELSITLSVYFVKPLSDYTLNVNEEERWIDCDKLEYGDWAPADKYFLGILKQGFVKARNVENAEHFALVNSIAREVMHETFDAISPEGQIDYVINLYLSPQAIEANIAQSGYVYKLVYFNGEVAGFYAYCPAKNFQSTFSEGTFLSKLYLKKFARGKKIITKILSSLSRPVYLTVKREDVKSVNLFKHYGFKIQQNLSADIGNGYILDDFLMGLGK